MSDTKQPNSLENHIYQRLLWQRIIVLGEEVRDENANALCAQLILLNAEDPRRTSPSTSTPPAARSRPAGHLRHDELHQQRRRHLRDGTGGVDGPGAARLRHPGKRYALPHARIMMHQPSGGIGGTSTDIRIQAEQSLLAKKDLAEVLSDRTGQPVERIEADFDRDRWFTPEAAKEYGIVDHVLTHPIPVPV
jgi:ATP-dependent Clp protease protease subunit